MSESGRRELDWEHGLSVEYFIDHPEEASPAAVRAMAQRLFDVGVATAPLGEQLPPGIRVHEAIPIAERDVRALAGTFVRSTAIHSRSRGWLPHIMVTFDHDRPDGGNDPQQLHLLIPVEHVATLVENLLDGAEAAERDAGYGLREDT